LPSSPPSWPPCRPSRWRAALGHHGRAVCAFEGRAGRVFIDGKEWAAELDEGEALDAGSRAEVIGVAGAHLKVRGA
jgi:inner membrane protein